ncbi:hypothetical protein RRG08_060155 [Elysia crispata]|uniref:Uncharacterized protein n=1 Tax=Elysia crispata TaxID=231223 RepID=A0AAE1DQQ2_9GAST|nr:hypothetical protein RRG08_060155 [Elysia crispata]
MTRQSAPTRAFSLSTVPRQRALQGPNNAGQKAELINQQGRGRAKSAWGVRVHGGGVGRAEIRRKEAAVENRADYQEFLLFSISHMYLALSNSPPPSAASPLTPSSSPSVVYSSVGSLKFLLSSTSNRVTRTSDNSNEPASLQVSRYKANTLEHAGTDMPFSFTEVVSSRKSIHLSLVSVSIRSASVEEEGEARCQKHQAPAGGLTSSKVLLVQRSSSRDKVRQATRAGRARSASSHNVWLSLAKVTHEAAVIYRHSSVAFKGYVRS